MALSTDEPPFPALGLYVYKHDAEYQGNYDGKGVESCCSEGSNNPSTFIHHRQRPYGRMTTCATPTTLRCMRETGDVVLAVNTAALRQHCKVVRACNGDVELALIVVSTA